MHTICIENDVKSWSSDAWRFLLRSAPEITAMQHTEHLLTVGSYLQDESRSVQCPQTTGPLFLSHPVVSVCDFGTLVAESRVWNGADRSVSLLCLASTRPEERTVWGFWGSPVSGCHWELSAGHKPEYCKIFGWFRCIVFRLRAHLAGLCCLTPPPFFFCFSYSLLPMF